MATLELQGLTKRFGEFTAVDSMNLKAAEGEMIALLGGSGCGKTTTLRMIAGFTEPTAGQILVDGKNVSTIPPYRRNIGIFFQNYALFPHMTVFENVAFGLKLQKLPKNEIRERVEHMLALVKLTGMDKRYPRQLSGGQQQRVALARPGIMAGALLAFLYSFDEVALSSLLSTPRFITLPIRIMNYMELTFDPTLAAISTLLILASLVLIVLMEKFVGLDMFVK